LDKDIPIAKKIVKTKIKILTKFKGEHLKANMIAANTISTMYINLFG
jgi:glutamate racemase